MPRTHPANFPSPRLIRACAHFGIDPPLAPADESPRDDSTAHFAPHTLDAAREIIATLQPGQIALITGPSGGGKSTLLTAIEKLTSSICLRPRPPRALSSVIDSLPGSLETALHLLACSGLADATLLARSPGQLSDGQRFRLSLAHLMSRATRLQLPRPPLLLIDEFASTLDRTTAEGIARTLHRWVARSGVRAICATAHDDLIHALQPALLIHQPLLLPPIIRRAASAASSTTSQPHECAA